MRFDPRTFPILKLLSTGTTVSELTILEPAKDESLDVLQKMAARHGYGSVQEMHRLAPKSLLSQITKAHEMLFPWATHRLKIEEAKQAQLYYNRAPDVIRWPHGYHSQLSEDLKVDQQAGEGFARMMKTPMLDAYFMPNTSNKPLYLAWDNLTKKQDKLWADVKPSTGILICERDKSRNGTFDKALYLFDMTSTDITISFVLQSIHNGRTETYMTALYHKKRGYPAEELVAAEHLKGQATEDVMTTLINRLLFIEYFQVEKILLEQPNPNSGRTQVVRVQDEKHESTINYPVNIIDARWYTTAIRDSPFAVSGHFRNQPRGKGRTSYELVYIHPYTKQGYVRRAKHTTTTASVLDAGSQEPADQTAAR
ncbi:MAG: hypothetical protein EOO39_00180 [Cytophagaceae bacterium]|nr:MAG: hypothetical protein EOO39_00180 [Cytophagaceae bacterium]